MSRPTVPKHRNISNGMISYSSRKGRSKDFLVKCIDPGTSNLTIAIWKGHELAKHYFQRAFRSQELRQGLVVAAEILRGHRRGQEADFVEQALYLLQWMSAEMGPVKP